MGTQWRAELDFGPLIDYIRQKQANNMALKFLQGGLNDEEINSFMVNHPNTFKRAVELQYLRDKQGKEQWGLEELKKLYESMQPTQVPGATPTREDISNAFLANRGGQMKMPFPVPEPPKTIYPSDEKMRNVAAMIEALGGNGLNIGKLLTERSQAGYYDAGAAERMSGIGVNQARQGFLGEQANLVKLQQQTEMVKPGEITARTEKIYADIVNSGLKTDADVSFINQRIEDVKQGIMLKAQQVEKLKQDGRLVEAKAAEQELVNKDVPAIKQAERALLEAKRQSELAGAGLSNARAQEIREGKEGKTAPLTTDQKNKLSDMVNWIKGKQQTTYEGKKFGVKVDRVLPKPKTRKDVEDNAEFFGFLPNHPAVKEILDYYFPQETKSPAQAQGTKQVNKNNDPLGIR